MPRGSLPGERRGGRKKGTPNKRTRELQEAMSTAKKQIEEMIDGAFPGDAHALLMVIYKDESRPIELRIEAAKAAIAYEKPRLSAIQHSEVVKTDIDDFSTEELIAIARGGPENSGVN